MSNASIWCLPQRLKRMIALCTREMHHVYMSSEISVRELRQQLGPTLDRVIRGEQILIRRNGKVIARIIPEVEGQLVELENPLRGSVVAMSDDFDAPLDEHWEALER